MGRSQPVQDLALKVKLVPLAEDPGSRHVVQLRGTRGLRGDEHMMKLSHNDKIATQ